MIIAARAFAILSAIVILFPFPGSIPVGLVGLRFSLRYLLPRCVVTATMVNDLSTRSRALAWMFSKAV